MQVKPPSDRLKELAYELASAALGPNSLRHPTLQERYDSLPYAIVKYLDEEHERRVAFEKKVEDFMHSVNHLPIWPPGSQS